MKKLNLGFWMTLVIIVLFWSFQTYRTRGALAHDGAILYGWPFAFASHWCGQIAFHGGSNCGDSFDWIYFLVDILILIGMTFLAQKIWPRFVKAK